MKNDNKDKYRVYAELLLIAASIYAFGYYKGRSRAFTQMIKLCSK